MTTQALVLGSILRRFPEFGFSMDSFDGRMRLQRLVYLLQAHGIYLGYDYSWHMRGPYDTALAAAGFMLDGFYDMLPGKRDDFEGFANGAVRARFKKFVQFIGGRESDDNFLGVAASLHFLLAVGLAASHDGAVDMAVKETGADKNYAEGVLAELAGRGLMPEDGQAGGRVYGPAAPDFDLSAPANPVDPAGLPRGMGTRHSDKALYFMIVDAAGAGGLRLVGKNIFRPGEVRPGTDNYIVNMAVSGIRRRIGAAA